MSSQLSRRQQVHYRGCGKRRALPFPVRVSEQTAGLPPPTNLLASADLAPHPLLLQACPLQGSRTALTRERVKWKGGRLALPGAWLVEEWRKREAGFSPQHRVNLMWWCAFVSPEHGRRRQEDQKFSHPQLHREFKASLGHRRVYLKMKK